MAGISFLGGGAGRTLARRVLVPLRRSRHARSYHAGGAAVGLAIAFTPTVGVQLPLVTGAWLFSRFVLRRRFNLVLAAAVTWTTNVATVLPVYTLFYLTGRWMLGADGCAAALDAFQAELAALRDLSWTSFAVIEALWPVVEHSGLALLLGCVPYALVAAALGYALTDALLARLQKPRDTRTIRAPLGGAR